jgi:hypothetical protein
MHTIPNPIEVLAVDDHAIFRQGIISLLAGQPDMKLVAEACGGLESLAIEAGEREAVKQDNCRKLGAAQEFRGQEFRGQTDLAL